MTHWERSCFCNRLLLGDKSEPVCSRIYRQPPSRWRSAFLRLMNWYFEESDHCHRLHRLWRMKRNH